VRARRPLFIGADLAINGLTGFGMQLGYQLSPHWAVDAAVGASSQLLRVGVRGRYNLLTSPVTPFVGLAALYGSGTPFDVQSEFADKKVSYRVAPSAFVQGVGGVHWVHRRGFTLAGSAGWMQLVSGRSNIRVHEGTPSQATRRRLDRAAGSGVVVELAVGYSF
jgi:hypothetical protein